MLKKITKICLSLSYILAAMAIFLPYPIKSALAGGSTDFKVDVEEMLSISITSPTEYASGNPGDFLRNKITVSASSNNAGGFVAGITAVKDSNNNPVTTLKSQAAGITPIPTLMSDVTCNSNCSNFADGSTDGRWGYSITDTDSSYGTYQGIPTSTINELFDSGTGSSRLNNKSGDVYFGALASNAASGTYAGAVNIIVISGTTEIATEPVNPAKPEDPSDDEPTYEPAPVDKTVYTVVTEEDNGKKTETSQVTNGDTTSPYPLGEIEVSPGSDSNLAVGLTVAAMVTATAGFIFFIVVKRRADDEDEEEQQQ